VHVENSGTNNPKADFNDATDYSGYYLEVINHFSQVLLKQITLDEILWAICSHVIAKLDFIDCVIYIVDETKNILIQRAAHGPKNPRDLNILNPIDIKIGEGIVGNVAKTKTAEIISDTSKDPRYIEDDDQRLSEITVPMVYEDQIIGVIDSEHPEKGFYTSEHLKILSTVASMAAVKIVQANAFNHIKEINNDLDRQVKERTFELERSIKKLEISNKELEKFGYIISHDLKSPLSALHQFCEFIELDIKSGVLTGLKEYLKLMKVQLKGMDNLIAGLLDYSRFNRDEKTEDINVKKIIRAVVDSINPDNNVKILDETPYLIIQNNSILLQQVFQNLITNAINYCDKEKCKITITFEEEAGFYYYQITDNGPGIAPEYHEKIFEMFETSSNVIKPRERSTGLGLAIVKNIVTRGGGGN